MGALHRIPVLGGDLRHFDLRSEIVFIDLCLFFDDVDHADERIFLADGKHDGERIGLQTVAHHLDGVFKVRSVDIHFVDVGDPGDFILVRLAPHRLALRLDAALRAEGSDRAVQYAQRTLDFHREIDVTRRIDDIDSVSLPLTGSRSGGDGDSPLLLLHHPVHGRRAVVGFAELMRLSCIKQDTLCRRGLSRVDVRHDTDVSGNF